MQTNNIVGDPMKMGHLERLPTEIIGKVIENLSIKDALNMMALNKHIRATIINFRQATITSQPEVDPSLGQHHYRT